eukprot:TRINITY_DN16894_c0_g1_i1.p1 TRINITY_DN16894_c0_g1~~TRINITY_DN16894_c0_g1_i1.p1  ORF type:complete len:716 (+),score=313.64 TRINITY_DN16894_c0_g1_i1:109-2256(+)
MSVRTGFKDAKRIMIKVGSNVLTNESGRLSIGRIGHLVEQVAQLVSQEGKEVILVSSGAVAVGRRRLDFQRRLSTSLLQTDKALSELSSRAAASSGQAAFMAMYEQMFAQFGLYVGNVLLTHADLSSMSHIDTFKTTIDELLSCSIIPVLNENDVTNQKLANAPVWFADNDSLSAKLATDLNADLLLLLTDVDGVYTGPPGEKGAFLLDYHSPAIDQIKFGEKSSRGRGGMESKINAANLAAQRGVDVVIASGFEKNIIQRLFSGEVLGTVFTDKWEMQALTPRQICVLATESLASINKTTSEQRTHLLQKLAAVFREKHAAILKANELDVAGCGGDKVALTPEQIDSMAHIFSAVATAKDPCGVVLERREITNGLVLERVASPLGVVLFAGEDTVESYAQAVALALRTGNGLIFYRATNGSSHTYDAMHRMVRAALGNKWPKEGIQLVSREVDLTRLITQQEGFINLIIPKGSAKLTKEICNTTKIPVLGMTESLCSVYVDKDADVGKAVAIALDSTRDVSIGCRGPAAQLKSEATFMDFLLIHESLVDTGSVLDIIKALRNSGLIIHGGEKASERLGLSLRGADVEKAVTIELVGSAKEAVAYVNRNCSSYADAIVTENDATAEVFLRDVGSACVFRNASTRFADGYRLGLSAETGVTVRGSARGPVGVKGLMTSRWVVRSGSHHTLQQEADGEWEYTHELLPTADVPPAKSA